MVYKISNKQSGKYYVEEIMNEFGINGDLGFTTYYVIQKRIEGNPDNFFDYFRKHKGTLDGIKAPRIGKPTLDMLVRAYKRNVKILRSLKLK